MPFIINPVADLREEMRRILFEQLDLGARAIRRQAPTRATHTVRKVTKRGRAIAALIRAATGRSAARDLDRAFRRIARPLGPFRDAAVFANTLADLSITRPPVQAPGDEAEALAAALRQLADLRAVVESTPLPLKPRHILAGLTRGYACGRKQLKAFPKNPPAESVHEWRKWTKRLGYHLQLVSAVWPGVMEPLEGELEQLHDLLGLHHDLAVLREQFPADSEIQAAAFARERALVPVALRRGQRIFAMQPSGLEQWLTELWRREIHVKR